MPLLSSRASGSVRAFGLTVLSALTSVIDLFTRADQSGLGTIKGKRWRVWRGVWAIVSNKASSSSAAGDNALATLTFTSTDVTVSISGPGPGTGASFWVTDQGNWWAAIFDQTRSCQTCTTCDSYSGGTCNEYANTCNQYTNVCNSYNCTCCNQYSFSGGNCIPASFCNVYNSANTGNGSPPYGFCYGPSRVNFCSGYNPTVYECVSFTSPCCCSYSDVCSNSWYRCVNANPVVCSQYSSYECNCVDQNKLKIIKSISSSVTEILSATYSSYIQSFKTILSGNNITVKAYSDSSYLNQIGSDSIVSSSGAIKSKNHGIIKSTSGTNQGSSIEEFGVEI